MAKTMLFLMLINLNFHFEFVILNKQIIFTNIDILNKPKLKDKRLFLTPNCAGEAVCATRV